MFAKDFPRRPMRRCYGASGERGIFSAGHKPMERPMPKPNDCSRSVTAFEQNSTLIAVIDERPWCMNVPAVVSCSDFANLVASDRA